jgi:hypothetical protein
MIECSRCGNRNPDDAEFCANPACRAYLGFDGKRVATLPGGVALRISNGFLHVEPGTEVVSELRIHNLSDVVDAYSISVVPTWATVEPQTVSLFPDKEQSIVIRFRPPRAPGTGAGHTAFTVKAISKSSSAVSSEQSGAIDVGGYGEMSVQMTPQISHAKPTATHRVAVENRGNTPLQVALEATDPEEALSFEIDRAILRIDPGKTELAQVQVRANQAPAKGPVQQHGFHLVVRPDASSVPPTTLDGYTLVEPIAQRPSAPWLFLLFPIAVLLLIAGLQLPRFLGGSVPSAVPASTSRIPNTSDLLAVDAARLLVTAGFAIHQAREPSETVAEGRVIRSDPAANLNAPKNSIVTVIVSSGKPLVSAPALRPVPQVAITINEARLLNSEVITGNVHLALYVDVHLPDGTVIYDAFKWNRAGAALEEGRTYPIEYSLGKFPAHSQVVITGYTDPDDGNQWPSIGHHNNYQGAITFGPLDDPKHEGLLISASTNDQHNPGFRVAITVTALAS